MHWSYTHCDAIGLMVVVFDGPFDVDDYVRMGEELIARPDWRPGMACLGDFSDCSFDHISTREISRAISEHIAHNDGMGPGPVALIMPKDIQYGLGRAYETRIEGHISGQLRVFRTRDEAYGWIMETV